MIVGSGLLARAFAADFGTSHQVCIYSAGVSNSGCRDAREFRRESTRLAEAMERSRDFDAFVYFGTCSAGDPEGFDTPYVEHKLRMERLVAEHPQHLILRLPQVAGPTVNPHTLLNYLYARISRSESFQLWLRARRNVVDVQDVAAIARELIRPPEMRRQIVNVANTVSHSIADIVLTFEAVIGKSAVCERVDTGTAYHIDTTVIRPYLNAAGVHFDDHYLQNVISKYYGK